MSNPSRRRHAAVPAVILALSLGALATGGPALAQSRVATEADLAEVRGRIERLTARVAERTRERDALTGQLAAVERRLAEVQSRRRALRAEQADAVRRLALAEERVRLQRAALVSERDALGRQLRAAYTSGRQERLKLVLNQRSPESVGRMLAYYRYLNDARLTNITALNEGLEKLAALAADVVAEQDTLERLAREAEALIASLATQRDERQRLVTDIDRRLADERRELDALAAQEAELKRLIDELSAILSDYPVNAEQPITALRGKLTWPVAGRLVRNFGQSLGGAALRSKGIVLATEPGTEVRAIYHGRVAYADWLPGLGLLMIVDHGDGLLSLYGYNETLTKSVGEWIAPGEVIATVGNTGGQSQPGLYFELRQGTRAVNPRPWFRNRPGAGRR
jgi:septal ring factor EnvC (AmiA/AmiB activator)